MDAIANSWTTPAPIKAAFFDIDGTLAHLGTLDLLPPSLQALEELRAHGVKCFVASGRGPLDVDGLPMELFDGMAFFNGQLCMMGETVVHDLRFSQKSLDALLALSRTTKRAMTFQGTKSLFSVSRSENFFRIYAAALDRFPLRDPSAILDDSIYQSSIECLPDEEEALIAQLPDCEIARWNPAFVDIIPVGGGKGSGARALLDCLGLSCDEAVAFGDSENDIAMFEACGTSVAVGGASEAAKAAATYVTDDIDDGGIYRACVRLGLF